MNRVSRQAPRLVMLVLALAALLLAGAPGATAAPAAGEYDAAVQKAATWIVGQQQADGSFPGFGVGSTADAIYALAAAGRDVRAVAKNGVTPIGFLTTKAKDYAKTPGAAAKLLLALATARDSTDPHNFGGVDLLQVIDNGYDAASGHYGKDVTGQALVLLAGKALNQPVPPAAVDWLVKAQAVDGGWAFDGSTDAGKADTNTTGLVLQALAAAHAGNATVVQKALAYLHAQQEADGGFAYQKGPGNASDTNSTALVAMGLQAAGESPDGA
ncbi:MAG TPA: prenyltransferase/squalene oxidase repeat-containing protein, partial [Chloroflexia bacterium]|nr:prenyltransferase/squalene oxidase repeat-containing protein [Chloroflexia bacterium]